MNRKTLKWLFSFAFVAVVCVCAFLVQPVTTAAEEAEEPLMRIVMMSDLHVEYNLQAKEKPIRFSIAKACAYARELTEDKGVDVVLVGGDMSGGRGTWSQKMIPATMQSIYDYLSGMTKDGKVMFVTGNHDPEPSVKANTQIGDEYSGDYSSFMKEGCGEFVSALYAEDIDAPSPYNELLCYRYTINGIEFIGLNTPYLENQAKVSGLYAEQGEWLTEEMKAIGADKTVILFCHYPFSSVRTIESPSVQAAGNTCGSALKQVLDAYPNVIYCYGHVHSGDKWWAKTSTADIVKPQGAASLVDRGVYKTNKFINAHMGSMGYYDNEYQPGGLSASDPLVVQFVMIELYANRIVFQAHNTGMKYAPGGKKDVTPLIIARDLAAQFGLDPSEGVYKKGDAYGGSSDTSTATSSTATTTDTSATTDTATTGSVSELPSVTDSLNTSVSGGENTSNSLPIILGVVLGVVVLGAVVFLLLFLKKNKKA
ncbi:MAG: metallophosphoesterase [Clostridia bacterium]|nr:metallophosphoesterase [Clostridia bacterium]